MHQISSPEDSRESCVFYINLHCGFELEQINLISLHITLAPGSALPYQVWIGKAEHFRKYSQFYDHTNPLEH